MKTKRSGFAVRTTTLSKSEQTRQRLLKAAAKVVGKVGYHKASISKITHAAKLASGGFYYYFKTRDELFLELLPMMGQQMIDFISDEVVNSQWGVDREILSFQAYINFLKKNPEFYRVFAEASVYAPRAYEKHFSLVIDNYCKALEIQRARRTISISEQDIPSLAYFLIGMRAYFSQMYMEKAFSGDLSQILNLYRRLLEGRIFGNHSAVTFCNNDVDGA
jgi:AcrR family transcriptional regulator